MEIPTDVLALIAAYLGEIRCAEVWDKVIIFTRKRRVIRNLQYLFYCVREERVYFDIKFCFAIIFYLKKLGIFM